MQHYDRVSAEINQSALAANIRNIRSKIGDKTRLMAVVKSNAYGHGIEHVIPCLCREGADAFAVASVGEGILVRALTDKPILVLGYTDPLEYADALKNRIDLTIFGLEQALILSDIAQKEQLEAGVHIKVETGMERIGFEPNLVSCEMIRQISHLPGVSIHGFFTHFARSDEKDNSHAKAQMDRMMNFLAMVEKRGVPIPLVHMANSAAIMEFEESYESLPYPVMVRAGIMLYGLYPSEEMDRSAFELHPVMTVKSHVVHLKWVEEGTPVGYGGTFVAPKKMKIATIPIGYGDGYPRHLSGKGEVVIRGQRAPITGRVCMDQLMVDVTDIEGVRIRDEVTVFGEDPSLDELAEKAGTIHYEIICQLTDRVRRIDTYSEEA